MATNKTSSCPRQERPIQARNTAAAAGRRERDLHGSFLAAGTRPRTGGALPTHLGDRAHSSLLPCLRRSPPLHDPTLRLVHLGNVQHVPVQGEEKLAMSPLGGVMGGCSIWRMERYWCASSLYCYTQHATDPSRCTGSSKNEDSNDNHDNDDDDVDDENTIKTAAATHKEIDRMTLTLNRGGAVPRRMAPSPRSMTTTSFVLLTSTCRVVDHMVETFAFCPPRGIELASEVRSYREPQISRTGSAMRTILKIR